MQFDGLLLTYLCIIVSICVPMEYLSSSVVLQWQLYTYGVELPNHQSGVSDDNGAVEVVYSQR